jgi:hypothetical protein
MSAHTPVERLAAAERGATLGRSLAIAGATIAALALLDPRWSPWVGVGPLLALAGLPLARERPCRVTRLALALAVVYALGAFVGPDFAADSKPYYAYARSLLFDRDLDFRNEWAHWGLRPLAESPTGLMSSPYPVGAALLWTPFVVGAHLYLLLLQAAGSGEVADGYALTYLRSAALGTLTFATVGAALLVRVIARRVDERLAQVAVVGAVLTSPMAFYLFVHPAMAHGLVFALSAALIFTLDETRERPSRRGWILVGVTLGLLTLVRWQCVVAALLPVLVGARALARREARPAWLAAGAGAALLAFVPQLLVWRVLYGAWLTVPTGVGSNLARGDYWFDWSSPRALDVLFSAQHGLFSWTPLVALWLLALAVCARRFGVLAWGGLAIFAITAWLNGSVGDWHGSHSFGARRFDVVVPFLAIGLAGLLRWLSARPLIAPVAVLASAAAWNAGLAQLYRGGRFPDAAPLEAVASAQARQLHRLSERGLARLAGPAGKDFAYRYFVGEYMFFNIGASGTIRLAGHDAERFLNGRWSEPQNRRGPAAFRWALAPRACAGFPLDRPLQDLAARITAHARPDLAPLPIGVSLNGRPLASFLLSAEWTELPLRLPAQRLAVGDNQLCLESAKSAAIQEGQPAIAVTEIQIGS